MTTVTSPARAEVVVLDLRGWSGAQLPAVAGPVVVLDDADGLADHTALFETLVGAQEVHHLTCVVVGRHTGSVEDGVLLQLPGPLLFARCTILWVGDEHGVAWSPAEAYPLPVAPSFPSGLDRLVDALRVPEVFARVRDTVEGFAGTTASPGTVLVSGAVDAVELADARTMVVRRLTAFDPDAAVPPPLADPASFALDRELPPAVLAGPVLQERNRARAACEAAQQTAAALPGWAPLFRKSDDDPAAGDPDGRRGRPGERLGTQVRVAARDAEAYRIRMAEVLHRIDGHLRVGRPAADAVTGVGVRPPTAVDPASVARQVERLVGQAVQRHYSLSTLAAQLRRAAAIASPQGCASTADALARRPSIERSELPPFRRLPLWGWTAPLILLTTLVVALSPLPGFVGPVLAVAFALAWFGAGWFLLARRPDDDGGGERGFSDSWQQAAAVYGLPGVVGAATGTAIVDRLRDVVPEVLWPSPNRGWVAVAVAVALFVGIVGASWPTAARAWVRGLRLSALDADLTDVMETAEAAIRDEWLPSQRRRVVAESFTEAAAALDEVGEAIAGSPAEGPGGPDPAVRASGGLDRIVMDELLDVLSADLFAVAQRAVAPAWTVLAAGRRHPAGSYTDTALRLLRQYQDHTSRHGLLVTPPFVEDSGPRDRLLARRWSSSPEADAALRADVAAEMVQLCSPRDLDWLDRQAAARLVRFAPHAVERVLAADEARNRAILRDRPIWTSAGELAGTIRLLPLRSGAVAQGPS